MWEILFHETTAKTRKTSVAKESCRESLSMKNIFKPAKSYPRGPASCYKRSSSKVNGERLRRNCSSLENGLQLSSFYTKRKKNKKDKSAVQCINRKHGLFLNNPTLQTSFSKRTTECSLSRNVLGKFEKNHAWPVRINLDSFMKIFK